MDKKTCAFLKEKAIKWIYNKNLGRVFPYYINGEFNYFICKIPPQVLKLPDGWYYNNKNGLTNRHNSSTGLYSCIDVIYKED